MQAYAETMAADQVAEQVQAETQAQAKATAPGAVASVVCGVIGLFVAGLIFGCIAISKAAKAKSALAEHPDQYTGGGMATAGMVLGVMDLIGVVFAVIVIMGK